MNETPLVSVCTITYNHAPYIRECLDSLLSQQTDFPFEIIIHDDHSTDGTDAIIRDYASRYPDIIRFISQEKNQYSQGVRDIFGEFVFPLVRGKYTAICEGDDYWTSPHKLQMQYNFMESHPRTGMVYTLIKINEDGILSDTPLFRRHHNDFHTLLFEGNSIPTLTSFTRTGLLKQYLKDIPAGQRHSWLMADYPWWLYVSTRADIDFIEEYTGVYRVVTNSVSHSREAQKVANFINSTFIIQKYFHEKYNGGDKKGLRLLALNMFRIHFNHFLTTRHPVYRTNAMRYLWNSPLGLSQKIKFTAILKNGKMRKRYMLTNPDINLIGR